METNYEEFLGTHTSPLSYITVPVRLQDSELITDLATEFANEVQRITRLKPGFNVEVYSSENFQRFCKTAVYLHVTNVNSKLPSSYRQVIKTSSLPALLATILLQIGIVNDTSFGLRLVPHYDIDGSDLLSPDEFFEFSLNLLILEDLGFKLVSKFPLPHEAGTLGFMACELISDQDVVLSYRHDHPVYGFYRSFFKSESLVQAFGLGALRVKYDSLSSYQSALKGIVSWKG